MSCVTVRFYGALNDFLPPPRRHRAVECAFVGTRSVKDLAEGLGVDAPAQRELAARYLAP